MANEFKVKKGLIVDGSNTVLDVQGTQGQLFSVTDSLTGDLFSVSDVSGIPILNVNSSGDVDIDGALGIGATASQFHADADDLVVGAGSGNTGITIHSGTSGYGSIFFADGTANDATEKRGQIRYLQGTERMDFHTDNVATAALSLAANGNATFAGNVGIGATGLYSTARALNLPGKGISFKNDLSGSNNNWSYIYNTATGSSSNLVFATGQSLTALTLAHSGNATFAGTIGSGAITSTSNIEAQDTFVLNYNNAGNKWQQLFDGSNGWNLRYYNGSSWSSNYLNVNTSGNATFAGTVRTNGYLQVINASAEIWIGDSTSGTDGGFIKWDSTDDYLYIGNSYSSAYNENIKIDNTGVVTLSDGAQYHKIQTFYDGSYTSGFKFSDYNGGIWYDAGADDLTLNSGHANSQILLNSGGAIALTLNASQNATFEGDVTVNGLLKGPNSIVSVDNRVKVIGSNHQMNIGQWDTVSHRIEGDSNRPIHITSYQGHVYLGTSGSYKLDVNNSGIGVTGTGIFSGNITTPQINFNNSGGGIIDNQTGNLFLQTPTSGGWIFRNGPTGYAEKMRLNSSGDLGVGDAAPSSISANTSSLSVNSSRTDLSGALINKANGTVKHQQYWDSSGYGFNLSANSGDFKWKVNNNDRMVVDKDGGLDIQGTAGQLFSVTNSLTGDLFSVADVSGIPILNVNSSGLSTFDGNVLVGKTAVNTAVVGVQLMTDGSINPTVSSDTVARFNRLTNDGEVIRIQKNTATVGAIGCYNGVPWIGYQGGAGGGIMFNGSSIEPTLLGSSRSSNTNDIGSVNYKWRYGYFGTAVNTHNLIATNSSVLSGPGSGTSTILTVNHGAGAHTGIGIKINSANSGHAIDLTGSVGSGYARITSAYNNNPDFTISGTITAGEDVIAYSDKKLKENIKTLDGSKVYAMRGVSFTRKDTGKDSSGVIAQEMQEVAPELVNEVDGILGVSYGNLVGYLIEAVKDQQKQIDELKKLIKNGDNL